MTSDAAKLTQLIWLGAAFIAVGLLGFFLATDAYFAFFVTLALLLLGSLPYHSTLAVYLSVATFSSAIIIPFAPGRPFLWEFAALLGWSGLLVTVAMRRYQKDFGNSIRENRWLFIGMLGYIAVLIFTMQMKGFGLRIFGGGQMGGRVYFQQFICAIFPIIFAMIRPGEKAMVRLVVLQYILSFTYLLAEFAYMYSPRELQFIFQFLDVTGDSIFFERQVAGFGFQRMASMLYVGYGMTLLLMVYNKLDDFLTIRGIYLIPLAVGLMAAGMFGGHRILPILVVMVVVVTGYAQRFFTSRNLLVTGLAFFMGLVFVYLFIDQMPLAMQRAVSILPGIDVQQAAYDDASGTMTTRIILRKIGWEMIPEYFWIGRGFSFSSADNLIMLSDPTGIEMHLAQGRFYNGFIGLMVNTGVFGTLFMLILMTGGTILAWRIIKRIRILGNEDIFLRLSGVLAAVWMANMVTFFLIHGDSEFAMKSFCFQSGMLIVCDYHLKMRMLKA